ncbi:imidazolonepropionase [Alteromonas pelagimontana]|uniref:Imidazolonepropionase n=1 Tax=Alteromonas pelagimontana TaxID=1858656 RepID=A0A6M4MHH6_9ALTE|nr:imidazolonepropionase [Alteromonas pelagimontana]QJR82533.1 imidazolonepropionase [Alteromonas pelagimontana]
MASTLLTNIRIASMTENGNPFGELDASSLRMADGKITELGNSLKPKAADTVVDGKGAWCLPGFVDCHTHLVYGGSRANEFSQRLAGVSYETISQQGGGIKSTVRATRDASESQLFETAMRRGRRLVEEGVTTMEIKSGYGLDLQNECRMLDIAQRVADALGIHVQRTFLGAHALPPDSSLSADEYIDLVCEEMLPFVTKNNLADAVDVFCESVGFTLAQTERVFKVAKDCGLKIKAHVEQLSDSKGALLAARYGAVSVDHVEYLAPGDVPALAKAGTVAVLLPGAFYYLKEKQLPPVQALRDHNVPLAVSTDINPGTSPIASLLTCANMSSVLFGLTTEEALKGITVNAAKALSLFNKGTIAKGADADLCLWQISSPDELIYEINGFRPYAKWIGGKLHGKS